MDSQAASNPRRPGTLAVHSLHRFVFSVPDLGEAAAFYRAFGLDVRETDGHLDLHTFGHPHRWGSIYQRAGPKRLEYLSFGAYADDFDALVAPLGQLGIATTKPHPLADEQGVWFADPDGTAVEIVVAPKVSPAGRPRLPLRPFHRVLARRPAVPEPAPRGPGGCRTSCCSRPTCRGRCGFTRARSGCDSPIIRATSSRSFTARMPATTTCSRSRNPMVRACIIHRGTSRRSTRSASACSRWPIAATRMAGA